MDTIIRVRRKRGAEPAEALVLSLKKARTDDEEGKGMRTGDAYSNDQTLSRDSDIDNEQR